MDFSSALKVSASGLSAQRTRLEVATENLANAETTRTPDGGPWRRRDVVFETHLEPGAEAAQVRVAEVRQSEGPGRQVYSPGHPDADAAGFVTLPDVNPIHEVANLMSASRGYEANATAAETLKAMALRALDIAR